MWTDSQSRVFETFTGFASLERKGGEDPLDDEGGRSFGLVRCPSPGLVKRGSAGSLNPLSDA